MARVPRAAVNALTYLPRVIRRRRRLVLVVSGCLILVGVALGGCYAAYQWRAARTDLAEDRPADARWRLAVCLYVWPRSPEVHLLAARAARLTSDMQAAEFHLGRCLALEGASQQVQMEFLLLRLQSGEVDEVAGPLIDCVEKRHPEAPLILESLARAYMHRLRYKEAFACLSRWIEEDPASAKAYNWRAWVYERLGRPKFAATDYEEVLKRDADHFAARLRIAEMRLEDHDPVEAEPHLERLIQQFPNRPEPYARLGQCRFLQGRHDEARRLLEEAAPRLPRDLAVRIHLARVDLQFQRLEEAEQWVRQALKLEPADTEALFLLASVLRARGRTEEAAEVLREHQRQKASLDRTNHLLRDEPERAMNDPDLAFEIGAHLLDIGRDRLGLYWLDRALLRDPSHQPSHKALADYYAKQGDDKKAAFHRGLLSTSK